MRSNNNNFSLSFEKKQKLYIEIPHSNKLSVSDDLTIEFWIYLREWKTGWTNIISKLNDDINNEFCFRTKNADVGQWYYGDGNTTIKPLKWTPKEDMNLNEWTHVACVRRV